LFLENGELGRGERREDVGIEEAGKAQIGGGDVDGSAWVYRVVE
jgi:hypothetical protein